MENKEFFEKYPMPNFGKIVDGVLYFINYVEFQMQRKVGKVLDAGCGTGEYLLGVATRHPEIEFTGLDYSESAIKIANTHLKKSKLQNVKFECGDINEWKNDNPFDYIVCSSVLEYQTKPHCVLGKLKRLLAKDGIIGISVPAYYGVGERICRLKDVLKLMCGVDYGAKDIKDLWDRMPEDHWIKDLFTEINFQEEGRLLNILRPYSYVTVKDIFKWLDDTRLTFVRFTDEHLWIPDFWNLQPLYENDEQVRTSMIQGFTRQTGYQITEALRGNIKKLEFFVSSFYQRKNWTEEKLMVNPFGAITENSFIFYDGTRMDFDSKRMMILKMMATESFTISEVQQEIREISPAIIKQFLNIMFRLGVIL
jgi:ubiquinone/menaquinone biosynthesis C-methylase UbiE